MIEYIKRYALYAAWAQSLISMLGSLYYSNVMHLPPCVLCWYQRIAMYPLVAILGFAIYKKDRNLVLPAFVLAGIGWVIALYHNLLYYKIIPEALAPCTTGVSCTTKFLALFGFATIPLQAFIAFTIILIALTIYWKNSKEAGQN